ncbi:hypothetical protein [Calderihabitans maritimus]|uniref:Uncharacterized protein n=1 Tax=Calderihabitans maritimus TaxID=1246530 RepID=A0A1Z5HXX4_9FIRM|nr:hypothetical protein [Calderihabitans maritimus]GAW94379.1 hypothetical protein KKC1_34850 [Calderihabitans maritimus]
MRALKVLLALILSILLIVNVVVGLVCYDLKQTVLQPGFYQKVLDENAFYATILNTLSVMVDKQLAEVTEKYRERIKAGLEQGLNEAWLKEQISSAITGLIKYLNEETPVLSMPISLTEVKEPVIKAMTEGLSPREAIQAEAMVKKLNEMVPDQLDAAKLSDNVDLTRTMKTVAMVRKIPGISLGLSIFIVLLLWFLGGFRLAALRWPGSSLLLAGALGVAIAVLGSDTSTAMLTSVAMPDVPAELIPAGIPALLESMFREVTKGLMVNAGVVALVGVIMIMVAFLFGSGKESSVSGSS